MHCQINTFSSNDNYSFIYLILPFHTNIRPFPLHLETKESGNANLNTFDKIKYIIEKSKNTKFKIILVSVDGDRYFLIIIIKNLFFLIIFFFYCIRFRLNQVYKYKRYVSQQGLLIGL